MALSLAWMTALIVGLRGPGGCHIPGLFKTEGRGLDGDRSGSHAHQAGDPIPKVPILRGQEAKGFSFGAGAGGAAHPMDVILGVTGQVVIDDMGDMVDVQTAGGDIGGDQDIEFTLAELVDGLFALGLRAAAMDLGRLDALFLQLVRHPVHPALSAQEDEDRTPALF
jgi:hypothetical protein